MVGLAVALTDAGVGDYWDDVEQYVRNGLVEAQATDRDELVRALRAGRARPKIRPGAPHDDASRTTTRACSRARRPPTRSSTAARHFRLSRRAHPIRC